MTTAPLLAHVSDSELTAELTRLVCAERNATASLLRLLGEFDRRQLYRPAGFTSLFAYCTDQLHLGDGAAYRRIEAARAARRFPAILDMLADGRVSLTAISLLAQHFTSANHEGLLAAATHKRTRDVERLAAGLSPKPDAPTVIRKVPSQPQRLSEATPGTLLAADAPEEASQEGSQETPAQGLRALSPPPRPVIAPLTPERFKLQITMDRETHDTLREIQDLIRHSVPTGDAAIIVARALALLREQLLRQKAAKVKRPRIKELGRAAAASATNGGSTGAAPGAAPDRAGPGVAPAFELSEPPRSRTIAAAVKRQVWQRDGGRCAFIGSEGRCAERGFLEFHHVDPFAAGGASSSSNIELRCRTHNAYEAELYFGTVQSGRTARSRWHGRGPAVSGPP